MTQKDNILLELKELNSSLANLSRQNVYLIPPGYFEGLAAQVMKRIKALEAIDAKEELGHLSPLLNAISKDTPYAVPTGYFEPLADNVLHTVRESNDYQTAKEELETLSPMLSGLKKANSVQTDGHPGRPYSVPAGYFENLTEQIITAENKPATKIISLGSRKWFRYAAAAVVTGLIILSGFLYFGKNNSTAEPGSKVMAKITRDVKNMDIEQQDHLIDFIDAGLNGKESTQLKNDNKSTEIKDMLIGISDDELRDFQEQSEDIQAVLLVN
ncbi:MAG: hypothetical protein ABIP79_03015 [Chitinophagaceae bacterium]